MARHETDRVHLREGEWDIKCVQCGKWFEASRSDASFCSPNCRVAYGREEQKMLNFIAWTNQVAASAFIGGKKYKRNKRVFEAMVKLQKDINAAIGLFEAED